jgi:hypothetical protein
MVGLRMDLRGDGLEHEHHLVPPDHGPEVVVVVSVAAAFVEDAEAEPGLIEVKVAARSSTMKKGVTLFNMRRISGSRV